MAISWTLIVLGALLHGIQCNADDSNNVTHSTVKSATEDSTKATIPLISVGSTISSALPTTSPTLPTTLGSTTLTTTLSPVESATPSTDSTTPTAQPTTKATSAVQTESSSTSAMQNPPSNPPSPSQNGLSTTQIQPTTAGTTANNRIQNSTTAVITTVPNQGTTNLNKPTTTISAEVSSTQLLSTKTNPSAVSGNTALPVTATSDSKSTASQSLGTMKAQTTTASLTSQLNKEAITTSTSTPQKPFNHSIDLSSSTEENIVHRACKTLGQKMKGNCTVTMTIHGKQLIAKVIIDADQEIPPENYELPVSRVADNDTLQKGDVNKDTIPDTLIAILASCGALVLILCCFAAYCTYHRRSYRKNQQHLTEELQTVENGYHDNPTLEVMEVQPEMQEKKLTMNGEFNDSWIVPIDNLLKEDIPDEEDTHL